ncbi:helix-turn-helix transcriptional regulator [Paenibacillus taichungensis]|uniref:helix-turn-helix transcriptional regulator n=1 Tax=Paenibacillus taichungensis TaxID=484184 RepID=UPI0035E2B3CE
MMEKPCSTLDLADASGVSQRSVGRWIFNNSTPKYDTACKAAKHLNRDVDELFVGIQRK